MKAEAPLVPVSVLRRILTARSEGCQCRAYLHVIEF